MIIPLTTDRDCLSPRSLYLKRLKLAAMWRKRSVMAAICGDVNGAREALLYSLEEVDEAARYRMDHMEKMRLR